MTEETDLNIHTHPWIKDKVLGTGGFGTVTLWRHSETGDTIALKKCRWGNLGPGAENVLTPKHIERWEKEVEIMNRLDHNAVVKCFSVPQELKIPTGDLPMLCMEYCTGGDLRKVLNRPENCCGLKEVDIRACLRDMTEAVAYLHSLRIIHRDLKPENIVLQNIEGQTRYKLIDLGYAKELEQGSVCTSFVGTLQYLAPELFLSKRYSCTVDYWSLGLVTHEIITGVRPFLPNWTPVEWMKKVRTKEHEHICVYEGRNGTVQFSSTIFPETQISKPLKSRIEEWLRVMLEWNPGIRGQRKSGNDDNAVVAFSLISDFLNKKVIKVFVVETCQLLEYEVTDKDSLAYIQELVTRDSKVAVEDQRPLLPRGQPPDPSRPATQCWAPPDEDEWLLYIFSDTVTRPHVPPHFPALVEEMLRQSRAMFDYPTQRRMWAHSIFFLRREARLLSLLSQAQKVSMLHLMSGHAQLTKTGQKMLSDIAKLQARHNLFMESLNTDIDMYDDQSTSGVSSNKLYRGWREMGELTLSQVHSVVESVQQAESSLTALNTKVLELQCSPFARGKPIDSLDSIISNSEELYSNLRRKSKEQRAQKAENTEMCKLMVQTLKKRDRLHQDLYKHLEKQCECLNEVGKQSSPLQNVLQDIARAAQNISNLQMKRQKDIWKIIEIAVGHEPSSGTPMSPSTPRNISELPHRPPSPLSYKNLVSLLENSAKESTTVISENRALRCQMAELISSNIATTLTVGENRSSSQKTEKSKTSSNISETGAIPKTRGNLSPDYLHKNSPNTIMKKESVETTL